MSLAYIILSVKNMKKISKQHSIRKTMHNWFGNIEESTKLLSHLTHSNFENDIIVFSHLRWEFVWQRPQHILSRLGKNRKILFVEEPFIAKPTKRIVTVTRYQNIYVVRPHIPIETYSHYYHFINNLANKISLKKPILWFYTPIFVHLIDYIDHQLVVYDCMDELSAFNNPPAGLVEKEQQLLKQADIIFTGGKSLYEYKSKFHESVYCFPSSVDIHHFTKIKKGTIPSDLKHISHPIIGYYGVIDERMDLQLLRRLAKRLSNISFVLLGPVVKIDPNSLPRLPNIYYLGQKTYDKLPIYLHNFDIAMIPFARNKATQYLSPTKTLEYMAAHKPIISTPIYDIVRDYRHVIKIVHNAKKFQNAISQFLDESSQEKISRMHMEEIILNNTSWNNTVLRMKQIITDTLREKQLVTSEIETSITRNKNLSFSYEQS